MKKIILSIVLAFAMITVNAQEGYVKYEFMKQLPGQDYENLEQSWINYHKELINAGVINMHRIWKVLPGNNVDYDYVVSTGYNNYADALGLGKGISIDDFKAKYPDDYKVMASQTLSTRTMVRDQIVKLEFGISNAANKVIAGKSILNWNLIKSKNGKYSNAEIKFSKKWHQYLIDNKRKDAFYLLSVSGSWGVDEKYTHILSHIYKDIDQMTAPSKGDDMKFSELDKAELDALSSYRDITKSILLLNVMNLEKP